MQGTVLAEVGRDAHPHRERHQVARLQDADAQLGEHRQHVDQLQLDRDAGRRHSVPLLQL